MNNDKDITLTPEQQAKIDALIAKTIAKERAKAEADYVKAKEEAFRLAGLTTDQMVEYELQQHEKSLSSARLKYRGVSCALIL